ncbi:MAG TPA: hypothetical protein VG797_11695 [Phycisphaerales bacterium]|nr:hypothetical protein [Phycisphaerales bacterium]
MSASRVRVIPSLNPRGYLAASVAWMLLVELPALHLGVKVFVANPSIAAFAISAAIILLPLTILAYGLAGIANRVDWVNTCSVVSVFAVSFAYAALELLLTRVFFVVYSPNSVGLICPVAGLSGIACVVAIVVSSCIYLVFRVWMGKAIEQDGRRCWSCAYDLSGLESERCPECGRPRTILSPNRFAVLARFVNRFGRTTCVVVIILLLLAALPQFYMKLLPAIRFRSRFMDQLVYPSDPHWPEVAVPDGYARRASARASIDDPGYELLISLDEPDHFGPLTLSLQLQLAPVELERAADDIDSPLPLHVHLTAAQSNQVLESGIPPALIDEMKREQGHSHAGQLFFFDPAPFFAPRK